MSPFQTLRGRGAASNPSSRFDACSVLPDGEADPSEFSSPATVFLPQRSRTAVSRNDSPDVGMSSSVNPYRGCEHGCVYCYARPTHEYFGLSAGLDFERRILIKPDLPELLRKELASPKWEPQVVAMSGVTDCYQPAEKRFGITRRCLEAFAEYRNPVVVITKSALVLRDIDVLKELARHQCVLVILSVTSLDVRVARLMEPRASQPARRLEAIRQLADARIPVGVNVAPVVPGLTDHEAPAILKAARQAGAVTAGFVTLRLPHGVKALFEDWLGEHFPDRKSKILSRIRSLRGGKLNDARFHSRLRGEGEFAEQIESMFRIAKKKAGFPQSGPGLSTASFRRRVPSTDLFPDA